MPLLLLDITGLFAAELLLKKGILTAPSLEQFYVSYLASAFRSIRFGINEVHKSFFIFIYIKLYSINSKF